MHPSHLLPGLALGAFLCGNATASVGDPPDVLFILVDDLGIDQLPNVYDQACTDPNPAQTPNIDQLAANGVTLDNFHVYPVCSPTRAALISGLDPIKPGNGIGTIVRSFDPAGFDLDTPTIFDELSDNYGYSVGVLGKWHLSPDSDLVSGFADRIGADRVDLIPSNHDNRNYFDFESFDGETRVHHQAKYSAEYITEQAIDCWANLPSPKLCLVSYTAVHEPWHAPPPWWTYSDWSHVNPELDARSAQKAMLEALDRFVGELLANVAPDTFVFFVSDNGTPLAAADGCTTPSGQGKGTLYEGGIRVPAIVSSPLLTQPGTHADGLVMVTDVFPTLVELAGGDPSNLPPGFEYESHSFLDHVVDPLTNPSQRTMVFAELFSPNRTGSNGPDVFNQKAVLASDGYKYIRDVVKGNEELYLLPDESTNLMGSIVPGSEADLALQMLKQALDDYSQHEQ